MFGSFLPQKLMLEREMLSRSRRLNPYDSSFLSLDISSNRLGKLDYRDYMNNDNPLTGGDNIHNLFINNQL